MIKTEAIILKSADSNEVDRLLTIYSEKMGKIKIFKKITDLIDEAIAGQEKDDDVWRLILMTLKALNEDKISFKSAVVDFQNNLITILGYDPEAVRELKDIY